MKVAERDQRRRAVDFTQSFLEDLRVQADLVQVVMDKVPLKADRRRWRSYKGLCPFHKENTPSFTVNPSRRFFRCFGCGIGGDVFTFIELYEKVSFPEAVRLLAARVGMPVPKPDEGRDPAADRRDRGGARSTPMIKQGEVDQPESTWNRTSYDEPIFILCGRDRLAPRAIRFWAAAAELAGVPEATVADAMAAATAMEDWQAEHGVKVPD